MTVEHPLDELQRRTGMGDERLAAATGVSAELIRMIRRGRIRRPSAFVEGLEQAGIDGAAWLRNYQGWRQAMADDARRTLAAAAAANP